MADYLAGQGSAYLLQLHRAQAQLPDAPQYLDIAPPYKMLRNRRVASVEVVCKLHCVLVAISWESLHCALGWGFMR